MMVCNHDQNESLLPISYFCQTVTLALQKELRLCLGVVGVQSLKSNSKVQQDTPACDLLRISPPAPSRPWPERKPGKSQPSGRESHLGHSSSPQAPVNKLGPELRGFRARPDSSLGKSADERQVGVSIGGNMHSGGCSGCGLLIGRP